MNKTTPRKPCYLCGHPAVIQSPAMGVYLCPDCHERHLPKEHDALSNPTTEPRLPAAKPGPYRGSVPGPTGEYPNGGEHQPGRRGDHLPRPASGDNVGPYVSPDPFDDDWSDLADLLGTVTLGTD